MLDNTDNTTLAQIVDDCAMLSIDERLTPVQQAMFAQAAGRLRAQLTVLLIKTFKKGTPALVETNAKITVVNTTPEAFAQQMPDAANTLEQVSALISVLDSLAKKFCARNPAQTMSHERQGSCGSSPMRRS